MAQVNMKREVEYDSEKVTVKSDVVEVMDTNEYMDMYNDKSKTKATLEYAINDAKSRLEQLKAVESTPEHEKLKEMLKTAELLLEKEKLQDKLKEMEKTLARVTAQVNTFQPTYNRIQNGKKQKAAKAIGNRATG